mgnify:CR=1 FL=1
MHPKLFEIGSFFLPTYGVLLALAYLLSLRILVLLGKREGMDAQKVFDLGLYILIAALLGAKLLSAVIDWEYYLDNPRELLGLVRLSGVFYGGFLCAILTAMYFTWRWKLPLWKILDMAAVAVPVGQSIGRIGCLSAGCCYGAPAKWGWSLTFYDEFANRHIGVPLGIPLYPTQIYLSFAGLITFGVAWLLYRRRRFDGWTFAWFLIVSSALRFLLELLRGDPRGTFPGTPLSTSQGISIALILLGAALLIYFRAAHKGAAETL